MSTPTTMLGGSCRGRASCRLLHLWVFAGAALLLATTAAVDTPEGFRLLGGLDSRGADLSKHCRVSHYYCANKCRNDTVCMGFTWVETGRTTGSQCCYTKSRLQDPLTPFRAGDAGYTFARDIAPAPAARSVFVFGDSLSDTGGVYGIWEAQVTLGVPEARRVPLARLGYFEHQYSNGKTWPLRIKEALPEALKDVEVTSIAMGAASVLPLNLVNESVISFYYPHLADQFATAAAEVVAGNLVRGNTSVCIIAAGSNDLQELNNPYVIFNAVVNPGAPTVTPGFAPTGEQLAQAQQVYVGNVVSTLVKHAFDLATTSSCDEVMLLTLPPLYRTPNFVSAVTFAVKTAVAASLKVCPQWPKRCGAPYDDLIEQYAVDGIADAINGLKAAVVGINGGIAQSIAVLAGMSDAPIAIFDAYTFINGMLDDPATYGFTDTTHGCTAQAQQIASLVDVVSLPVSRVPGAPMQMPHAEPARAWAGHAAHSAAPRAAPAAEAAQPAWPAAAAAPVASAGGGPATERPASGATSAASARGPSRRGGLPARVGDTSLRRSFVLSIPVARGANWFLAGGGRRMDEEEATAAAAERIAAAAEDGTSLPVRLATDVVRFLYGGTGRREPADGGVVSASLLNAKPAVGGIGVEPRGGGVLRVLFTVASDAVADTVVRWRHELRRCVDSTAVFDVLSDREEAQHQALWPAFLAAKVAGKRAQFHRARLVVDGERVPAPAC
ncbi:hypothetical protein FOA52_000493 [Chlamydomonas sp. UWO 241]|nr:hypothetical protein FOA52_000493 [Chlamydomonas sp. UWO 241]